MLPAYIAAWALKKRKGDEMPGEMGSRRFPAQPSQYIVKGPSQYSTPTFYNNTSVGNTQVPNLVPIGTPAPIQAKGGGGAPAPKVPTPMEEAQATLFLENERAKTKATQDAAAKVHADAEKAALKQTAAGKQAAAYGGAQTYGKSQLANRGYNPSLLDKYNVYDQYLSDIGTQKAGWGETEVNPQLNTSNALMNAVNTAQGTYRGDVTRGINAATGTDFEKSLISDTMDDAILQTILGKQNATAKQSIETAHQRGMLNDVGYANALAELGTANTAGMGQLQQIGQGVLGGYRTGLTNAKNTALQAAGGLTLADLYDVNAYNKGIQSQVGKAQTGLQGDIYNAVGSQQFFDPNKIIASAGAGQGYFNPGQNIPTATGGAGTTPLLEQMTEAEKRRTSPTSQVF